MNWHDPSLKNSSSADLAYGLLQINLNAILSNYQYLCQKASHSITSAVLKANAYGLGAEKIAPLLEQQGHCRHFFVAHLQEGIALRKVLSREAQIFVLNGLVSEATAQFITHNITPVLNTAQQYKNWQAQAKQNATPLPAIIQLDSGMHRLGLSEEDVLHLQAEENWLKFLDVKFVISHLACAADPHNPINSAQLLKFKKLATFFPNVPLSLAASSGIFLGPEWQLDMVRPGAALYGINPTPSHPNPMENVITVSGKIIQIRTVKPSSAIGYNGTHITSGPARIAIVSVGYADGFFRILSNKGIAVAPTAPEIKLPIVGNISMDCLCVDISALPEHLLTEGSMIELIGANIPLDCVGEAAKTIGYEILTALDGRLYKNYSYRARHF